MAKPDLEIVLLHHQDEDEGEPYEIDADSFDAFPYEVSFVVREGSRGSLENLTALAAFLADTDKVRAFVDDEGEVLLVHVDGGRDSPSLWIDPVNRIVTAEEPPEPDYDAIVSGKAFGYRLA